jgi:hypothetical protein
VTISLPGVGTQRGPCTAARFVGHWRQIEDTLRDAELDDQDVGDGIEEDESTAA